jgi:ParB-like chromosome segregation protein Spo0J
MKRELVYRDPRKLRPHDRNARTHSDAQVRQIRASIDEYGFTAPILLRGDFTIGAGHGRWLAALLAPRLMEVPTIVLDGLTDAQWRAYVLADNRLALNSAWDYEMLRREIVDLHALGELDLHVTGFSPEELTGLLHTVDIGVMDPDAEWLGMPEYIQEDAGAHRSIIIHLRSAEDVQAFLRAIGQEGLSPSARFTWFPREPRADFTKRRYMGEP